MRRIESRATHGLRPVAAFLIFGFMLLLLLSVLGASFFSSVGEEKRVWFELSFLLLAAVTAELLVLRLKQPLVMVLLLVGIVISPSAISVLFPLLAWLLSSLAALVGVTFTLTHVPYLVSNEGLV